MNISNGYKKWEIYWAKFEYEDKKELYKIRPVIVLGNKSKNKKVVVACIKITGHAPRKYDRFDYSIKHWEKAGLKKQSTARISKILSIDTGFFKNKIGKLDVIDITNINRLVAKNHEETKKLKSNT